MVGSVLLHFAQDLLQDLKDENDDPTIWIDVEWLNKIFIKEEMKNRKVKEIKRSKDDLVKFLKQEISKQ
jgi:hypothetical protein